MNEFETVVFAAGQRIFNAGDVADHLYVIQQGQVQLLSPDGQVFATLPTGESFGEQAFLSGGIRGASAQAFDEVTCLKIPSQEANQMMGGASPLLVPVFEALLLQLNMNNALRAGLP